MSTLTLEHAKQLLSSTTTEPHLFNHALAVSSAMGAYAAHFDEDVNYWQAVGFLHDYDYEQYPQAHLQHTEKELLALGVDETAVRAIMAHGYGLCSDVAPITNLEKALYTVDELTGIIGAAARMRPLGITDLEIKSFMKKFKDKKFAAKCDRSLILSGCDMLGMEITEVADLCIAGMKTQMDALGLGPKQA